MTDRPTTSPEAMTLALDWAEGLRSWTNLGKFEPYTPDVIAVMDAQEVVKWSAVAAALAQLEHLADVPAVRVPQPEEPAT